MKKLSKLCLVIFTVFFVGMINVNAGSLTASASYSTVYTGSSVTINVSASGIAGKFSITSSNSSVLSGGTSSVWLDDESAKFYFTAVSAGSATITIKPIDAADYSTGAAYTQTRTVTVRVINKVIVVLSSNNNLDNLGVDGYTLTPSFNADTLEYSLQVDSSVEKINVTAGQADGTATLSGTGEKVLADGANKIEIICTAQNGTPKTYTLTVNVEDLNPIKVTIGDKEYTAVKKASLLTMPATYSATTIKITDIDVPAFKSDITGYVLVGLKDAEGNIGLYVYDSENSTYKLYKEIKVGNMTLFQLDFDTKDIPLGFEKGSIKIGEDSLTVYKLNDNSNYSLIYAMNISTGKKNIYMYDSVENTIQIYNTEELVELNKTNDLYFKIILGLGSLSGLLFISLIITLIVKRKKKKTEKEQIVDEVIEEIIDDKTKELKLKNLLFDEDDEEETRSEKNQKLTDSKELKKLEKITKKEEKLRMIEEKKLNKKRQKEAKKNKNKVKVTKIEFDDEGSL